jgi:hypothetical protein
MPNSALKATTSAQAGAPIKRSAPLPSCPCGIYTSFVCIVITAQACIGASCSDLCFDVARAGVTPQNSKFWNVTKIHQNLKLFSID